MKATVLLADYAITDPAGKIHAIGMGWSTIPTPTPPHGLIVLLEVAWDETNRKVQFLAELVDADGKPVTLPGPVGAMPVQIQGDVEAGRPPGLPHGTPIICPLTVNVGPGLALIAGQRYEWRLSIDGKSNADWSASFLVTAHPPQMVQPGP